MTLSALRFGCATPLLLSLMVSPLAAQSGAPARAVPQPAAAIATAAAPTDYRIGAEDVLGVAFWREPEMSGDVTVRPDGNVTIPLVGDVRASGLTPEELKTSIQKAAEKYLTDVSVSVIVRQINSRKVFITGEVRQPNAYPLSSPRNVLQLITLAGGLTEYADAEHITIMREVPGGTPRTLKFNFKDVAKGKHPETNIQLQPGDMVIVP